MALKSKRFNNSTVFVFSLQLVFLESTVRDSMHRITNNLLLRSIRERKISSVSYEIVYTFN